MSFPTLRVAVLLVIVLVSVSADHLVTPQGAESSSADIVLSPDATVDGLSLADWSARWWQWFFSVPHDINPYWDDSGERCGIGQSGQVFFLMNADHSVERSCVVPAGLTIFVPIIGSECSTVEPPPFLGRNETELRQCATGNVDTAERMLDMSVMRLAVDGKDIGRLSDYRTATPLFTLWLPPGNELGADKPVADAVADGYQVMLSPLPEGDHVVEMSSPGPNGGETVTITYRLSIKSGAYGETSATPVEATPEGSPQPSGSVVDTHVDVGGGRMLHVRCAGAGSPTIVYEAGGPSDIGASSLIGTAPLGTDLAGVSRFCAYDRAWQTSSDPAPDGPRTFRDSAADLHALLSSPELECPCVLIGESMGGAISLILASMHPEDRSGLILLDPPPPGLIEQILELAPAGSPEADLANGFPPDPEHFDFLASLRQVETPSLPAKVPVEVLTHGQGDPPPCFPCSPDFPTDQLEVWWQHAQDDLAKALNGKLVVAEDSSHFISTDQPDLIVAATREVVSAVQDPTTWPPKPSPSS